MQPVSAFNTKDVEIRQYLLRDRNNGFDDRKRHSHLVGRDLITWALRILDFGSPLP